MRREAARRRPAKSERKNCAFSAKRQAVWFEAHSVSNRRGSIHRFKFVKEAQMKQRTALLSLLLVMAFSLSACQMPGLQRATTPPPPSEPQIALALPRSGPYAPIAGKIIQGANLAVKELQTNGIKIKLNVINTSAGDWIAKVNALPAANAVIGGPLHGSAYAAARKAGLLEKRAFFAFMPALETGDEGTRAWRFSTSRRDQIDAIVDFSTDTLKRACRCKRPPTTAPTAAPGLRRPPSSSSRRRRKAAARPFPTRRARPSSCPASGRMCRRLPQACSITARIAWCCSAPTPGSRASPARILPMPTSTC